MKAWQASAISERGLGHASAGIPCQDVALAGERNGVIAITLSDGAGTATLADAGAKLVDETSLNYLLDEFDSLYHSDETSAKEQIVKRIVSRLEDQAIDDAADLKAYSATLLAVAVKGERYIAVHVGDGVIAAMHGDALCVLSHPSNGEHANETIFVNSQYAMRDMRLLRGRASAISGFILMSDGSEQSLYDKANKSIAPAVVKLFVARLDMSKDEFDRELADLLKNQIIQRTSDDCSIALMVRDRNRLRRFHKTFVRQSRNRTAR